MPSSTYTKRQALKKAGATYHPARYSDWYRPGAFGPSGKVDHGGPGWTLPGAAERMTLDEAFERLMESAE